MLEFWVARLNDSGRFCKRNLPHDEGSSSSARQKKGEAGKLPTSHNTGEKALLIPKPSSLPLWGPTTEGCGIWKTVAMAAFEAD